MPDVQKIIQIRQHLGKMCNEMDSVAIFFFHEHLIKVCQCKRKKQQMEMPAFVIHLYIKQILVMQ